MCNVYSFSGFAKVLIKNGITFSIRDFLDNRKVDQLIQKLIDKVCDEDSFAGAGISRSCFIDPYELAAIKVDKSYYVDINDERAAEEWEEYYWDSEEGEYDPYGYAYNDLSNIVYQRGTCEQNLIEIETYQQFLIENSELLSYVPTIYAISSNKTIEIMEKCDRYVTYQIKKEQSDRLFTIRSTFHDAHDGNIGLNKQGLLVLLDYGFEMIE